MPEGLALHRGREYNRGTGCGKTARPGLHGGCRVTGIPTVEVLRLFVRGKKSPLDVHFISSLPVMPGTAYKAWVDSKPVQMVWGVD